MKSFSSLQCDYGESEKSSQVSQYVNFMCSNKYSFGKEANMSYMGFINLMPEFFRSLK